MAKIHKISTAHLSIDRLQQIIENGYKLELSDESKALILKCRKYLDDKIKTQDEPIYGVSTGFGCFCDISVSSEQLSILQRNLVMSHACGVGDRVPNEIVKLMLILKIQSLSYGYSGVQLETVQRLVDFYNNGVCPVVYQQGSLGASGDLVPLAHLCLPILNLGEVNYKGKDVAAHVVNQKFGWEPITLQSKEGLALLNGTQFMGAYGCWCIMNAKRLSAVADVTAALSIDAFDGRIEPFHPAVHAIRPHKGQIETARRIRELLAGSEIITRKKTFLYLSAHALATGRTLTSMKKYFADSAIEDFIRVKEVTEISDQLRVKDIAESKVAFYYENALANLDKIDIHKDNKADLYSMAEKLLVREY
jgi:histidine ammonia-lyase